MSIERVFVAGAGLMGHGIAQVHAAAGKHVTLYEPELERATAGRERVAGNLARAVEKGRLKAEERKSALARIEPTDDLTLVAAADLVVEAVFEDLEVKRGLWRDLDAAAPVRSIFASNTSSISIDRLAEAVGPGRRSQFVGMHFFSPVPVMPLVELIQKNAGTLRLRPDQRLVYLRNWDEEKERLAGVARLMQALVKLARAGMPEATAASMPKPTPELVKARVAGR